MKIQFYAHASFRLESNDLSILTDPYTPGPQGTGFDPIDEPAGLVIMSSATDRSHSNPSHQGRLHPAYRRVSSRDVWMERNGRAGAGHPTHCYANHLPR